MTAWHASSSSQSSTSLLSIEGSEPSLRLLLSLRVFCESSVFENDFASTVLSSISFKSVFAPSHLSSRLTSLAGAGAIK